MRTAFLGLGIMGRPMAANLVKAGHEVTVWNRTPGKDVPGAKTANSPAEAVKGNEAVWMCVSDTKAVEQTLFGPNGAAQALEKGAVVVDSSTIAPSASVQFAARLREKGCDFLDAPVTGSKVAAEGGTLIF
ncbi:MAG TPA: NAD(P)-dependent oxidoreductase, partial [Candidatus Angelobacter sp.]|nr:NAD(P)-dependent oxidoreductase [Candidatus Angelobacter sp.]